MRMKGDSGRTLWKERSKVHNHLFSFILIQLHVSYEGKPSLSLICFLQLSHMWGKMMTDIWGEKSTVSITDSEDITGVPGIGSLQHLKPCRANISFHCYYCLKLQTSSMVAAVQRLANDCWSLSLPFIRMQCMFFWSMLVLNAGKSLGGEQNYPMT